MDKAKNFLLDKDKQTIFYVIISGICLILSFLGVIDSSIDIAWVAVILCGTPILKDAIIGLCTHFDIRAGVLVSLALIASVSIGAIFVAGEVAFIMQLGEVLENMTSKKTKTSIQKLLKLLPDTARVIENGEETILPTNEVKEKMIVQVNPGETIPVDGVIIKGETSINQAIVTGESMPIDKKVGDAVYSGTINQFGSFIMEVTKTKKDSSLQRLINLVQDADLKKAKVIRITDKWATALVVIAFMLAIGTWIVTGEMTRGVTILVVFCPCALILATPTAIMAGVGNATKKGALIKNGEVLEKLGKTDTIVLDKTGTLTYDSLEVTHVQSFQSSISEKEFVSLLALVESKSEHIIGKTIVKYAKENKVELAKQEITDFKLLIGKGVCTHIMGQDCVIAGNEKILAEYQVVLSASQKQQIENYIKNGNTIVCVAKNREPIGFVALSDTIKEESKKTIEKIKEKKIEPIMLTGDNVQTAKNIANSAGISNYYAECIPEDKLDIILNLQKQGKCVCMVGDGINDAPSLKNADIGIAMGEFGSSIAIDVSDIVLISDKLDSIPYLIELSNKTMRTIHINLIISLIINLTFITLSMLGLLTPMQGAIVHNCGSVAVVIHSALLLKWKGKGGTV